LSNIHTLLVILWSIRLTIFLLHREFVNWKEWHTQLNKTNRRSKKTTTNKIPIWFTCSTCYSCMIMPCVYRLKASTTTTSLSSSSSSSGKMLQDWGIIGKMGIILQSIGLLLETIADAQKAKFKKKDGNRHLWCNVGLWSFSTYPNYLGEVMFWFGTYIGGISCCDTIMQFTMCTVGLIFILMVVKGAIDSLSSKHMRKWGHDDEWLDFKRTHSILGPIQVKNKKALPIYR
jgi:steroid 5-alpha reductase family enzyme